MVSPMYQISLLLVQDHVMTHIFQCRSVPYPGTFDNFSSLKVFCLLLPRKPHGPRPPNQIVAANILDCSLKENHIQYYTISFEFIFLCQLECFLCLFLSFDVNSHPIRINKSTQKVNQNGPRINLSQVGYCNIIFLQM